MLVASRVKIWVEPLLYRVVFLIDDPLERHREDRVDGLPWLGFDTGLRLISDKPTQFFADSVHHLFIDNLTSTQSGSLTADSMATIAAAFYGVTDLFANVSIKGLLPIIGGMTSLNRLGARMDGLFDGLPVDFGHGLFQNLTHLEVFDEGMATQVGDGLPLIPNLTHFAFDSEELLVICARVLQTCRTLQYLIFVSPSTWRISNLHVECTALAEDSRFMAAVRTDFRKDWQLGVLSRGDFWLRAEEFVALKRAGKLGRLEYLCTETT
ncbi:hypothetical protein DFH09DRAFT_393112 [Mycena vulgaris]|nr:hypothetical protein DFH09DRAFT_393112 [Mycena vulgaris]